MMQAAASGNVEPSHHSHHNNSNNNNNNNGDAHESESDSYTYSTSSDADSTSANGESRGEPQVTPGRQQFPQQPMPVQRPPVLLQNMRDVRAAFKSKKEEKKAAAAAAKQAKAAEKERRKQPQAMEEGGDGEGNTGDRRRRGISSLPGVGRIQAITTLAATPASADTQRITIYLFFLFSVVHLLFILLSCVLSQLDISGKACYTFWGFKADCDATSYTIRTALLPNKQLKQYLQAGAAMSIFAVLTAAGVLCVAWLLVIRVRAALLYQKKQRLYAIEQDDEDGGGGGFHNLDGQPPEGARKKTASLVNVGALKRMALVTMGTNLLFELVAWVMVVVLYSARPGEEKNEPRGMTYGVGFGLGITAWIGHLIMLVLLVFLV